jgi:hypothetical protein
MKRLNGLLACGIAAVIACAARGEVVVFTDKSEWEAAAGEFVTADFTGFNDAEPITDQYAHLGVEFVDGFDIARFIPTAFPNDEWGLDGNAWIDLEFAEPMHAIAMDHPGLVRIAIFDGETEIFTTGALGDSGAGWFSGLTSTIAFDRARIWDPNDSNVALDDLHFGPPIPAPGAAAILLIGFATFGRRRR